MAFVERIKSMRINQPGGTWDIEIVEPFSGIVKSGRISYKTNFFIEKEAGRITKIGKRMEHILSLLLITVKDYPFEWEYSDVEIDDFNYAFEFNATDAGIDYLELTFNAYQILLDIYQVPDEPDKHVVENEYVPAGGVLSKFKITLPRATPISFFSIHSFSKYPIEIASITYVESTEVYSPLYEIKVEDAMIVSNLENDLIGFQFPEVIAKELYFIVRQRNYEEVENDLSIRSNGRNAILDSILNNQFNELKEDEKLSLLEDSSEIDEWLKDKIREMGDLNDE